MIKRVFTAITMVLTFCMTASAQTDVTKFFLENYGFDDNFDYDAKSTKSVTQEILDIPGWTQDFTMNYTITGVYQFGFQGKFNNGTIPAKGYDGEDGGGLALSTGWDMFMTYYQEVTLPAGKYTIKAPTYNGFTATAGYSQLAWVIPVGYDVESTVAEYKSGEWVLDQISFTLTEATEGKIQIGYKAGSGGSANSANIVIDYVQILGEDMDVKPLLAEAIKAANEAYGDGKGVGAEELKAAIEQAQAVYDKADATIADVLEARKFVEEAVDKYKSGNASEDNPIDCTDYIKNPSFEDGTDGWTVSDMARQSNSSFTKKKGTYYMEKWVGSGAVGNGSVKQTVNIPNGVYRLTVAAQNYTQSATSRKNTGAYIFAGTNQTIVYTPADYSVNFKSIAGQVEIGFVAENATGNWISVDNFRLEQIGYVDDSEIVAELQRLVDIIDNMAGRMMAGAVQKQLTDAQAAALDVINNGAEYNPQITLNLQAAIEAAKTSIAEYQALQTAIDEAKEKYDETKEGADEFKQVIDEAEALVVNAEATSEQLAEAVTNLANAQFLFLCTNGTGVAPKVTTDKRHVVPAAHGGLVRATFTGSNLLERGVCWSTEKEPTIADNRETTVYSLNGTVVQIKGMQPSSVYYARPYAVTRTYAVGYGEPIKVVTLPKGGCSGSWDNGAPSDDANTRCRDAINQTIDYLNEWTAIKGFHLQGHYGSGTPTADCSYGGYMRIGPNAGNQAIGTVIHETGHGVGVGTHWRWYSCADTRENTTYGKWLGSYANKVLDFLENDYTEAKYMTGDGVHGWGQNATYDWFVNGADKDTHQAIQYIGGCALLYGLYIDGLCPTSSYANGVSGYTFDYDESQKYLIVCEDEERGRNDGFITHTNGTTIGWKKLAKEEITDEAMWTVEYEPVTGYYRFKNAANGYYLTHANGGSFVKLKNTAKPAATENFMLMPGRKEVSMQSDIYSGKVPSYWFTWTENGNNKSMSMNIITMVGYGSAAVANFDYSNKATTQRYILIPVPDDIADPIENITTNQDVQQPAEGIYTLSGIKVKSMQKGINIIHTKDGKVKKVYVE